MSKLAILGGDKVRTVAMASRPHIDETETKLFQECLDQKTFSRFVGSPVGDFRRYLAMTSEAAEGITDFASVLGGNYVRKFEAEFARLHQCQYAVSSNSATSSITSAVLALNLDRDAEVITTPFSFTASATGIRIAGPKVVFADIDPRTFCVTAESVEKRITPKTRAIMPVHLLGNAGDIIKIKELCDRRGLHLIEDSAQAIFSKKSGQYLGTFGKAGIFSFQETKNMMTGEGGMAITNDPEMAYRMRLIRNHGESMVYDGVDSAERIACAVGYNFRLQEPLAALGYSQARKLKHLNGIRRKNYEFISERLKDFDFVEPVIPTNDPGEFVPYCLGMNFKKDGVHRNTFAAALRAEGVPVSSGFGRLMNENPFTGEDLSFTPVAKWVNNEAYLGFFQMGHPNTTDDMLDIVRAFEKISGHWDELRKINDEQAEKREYNSGRL